MKLLKLKLAHGPIFWCMRQKIDILKKNQKTKKQVDFKKMADLKKVSDNEM